ncbi:MAG TPA: hypothetical protein VLT87_10975 [Thermoanaerobaculia bacterium]|nr:hypothetical protein [Thermoanaerobaculia bacterium]
MISESETVQVKFVPLSEVRAKEEKLAVIRTTEVKYGGGVVGVVELRTGAYDDFLKRRVKVQDQFRRDHNLNKNWTPDDYQGEIIARHAYIGSYIVGASGFPLNHGDAPRTIKVFDSQGRIDREGERALRELLDIMPLRKQIIDAVTALQEEDEQERARGEKNS